jgi:phosphatidylserine/phosphatidylglycerophosphate/cardiolipin synthase-like enzyme
MFDIQEIYTNLGGPGGKGDGFGYGLSSGNALDQMLNTPNLWGHNPAITDYVPAAKVLTDAIENLIAQSVSSIDISSLYHLADGYFLDALRNGIQRAYKKGNKFVVRIIVGLHWPYKEPKSIEADIDNFIKSLNVPQDIEVYVAGMQTAIFSMNHAKLVIVDGATAISGGHNMWSVDYNEFAPAHDFSMQISGPAVHVAEGYLNEIWTRSSKYNLNASVKDKFISFIGRKSFGGVITNGILENISSPIPGPQGPSLVLAVARMGEKLMPEENVPGYDASHFAKLEAVRSCESQIRFTTPWVGGSPGGIYDKSFIEELCKKIISGVQVSLIMSEVHGTTSNGDVYYGASIEDTAKHFVEVIRSIQSIPKDQLIILLDENLHIAPIRIFDKQPGDPKAESWKWSDGQRKIEPANHAKIYIFDEDGFYFGSENSYALPDNPLGLQEFGFIVAGQPETKYIIDEYWSRGWQYSQQFEFKDWAKIIHF